MKILKNIFIIIKALLLIFKSIIIVPIIRSTRLQRKLRIGSLCNKLPQIYLVLLCWLVYTWRLNIPPNIYNLASQKVSNLIEDEGDMPQKDSSIFFHESSSLSDKEWKILIDSRQACAVEAAARLHPDSTVYLIFSTPVRYPNASEIFDRRYRILNELLNYENIKIRSVSIRDYVKNTPLENSISFGSLSTSFSNIYLGDLFRYISLWKFGGTYLDLDVILMKPLGYVKNFAGKNYNGLITHSVLNFDSEGTGHSAVDMCLRELGQSVYNWDYNSSAIISNILKDFLGFNIFSSTIFYPFSVDEWKLYFNPKTFDLGLKRIKDSHAIKLWSINSKYTSIFTRSKNVLLGYVAKMYCPHVYQASGSVF